MNFKNRMACRIRSSKNIKQQRPRGLGGLVHVCRSRCMLREPAFGGVSLWAPGLSGPQASLGPIMCGPLYQHGHKLSHLPLESPEIPCLSETMPPPPQITQPISKEQEPEEVKVRLPEDSRTTHATSASSGLLETNPGIESIRFL